MTLIVIVKHQEPGLELQGFPFIDGQYVKGESTRERGRVQVVSIDLADMTDTTAAQEQFLDTNDAVYEYEVRAG